MLIIYVHLPVNLALLSTPLFTNRIMCQQLKLALDGSNDSSRLRPSGIPPQIEVYKQLDRALGSITSLPGKILEGMGELLESKGVAAGNITKSLLKLTIKNAISDVCRIRECTRLPVPLDRAPVTPEPSAFDALGASDSSRFILPSVDVATAWRFWWLGNQVEKSPLFPSTSRVIWPKQKGEPGGRGSI